MIEFLRFANCPYCDKVQEFMDANDVKYRMTIVERDNKPQEVLVTGGTVPVIKDNNGHLIMSESDDIIAYLKLKFNL